MIYLLDTNICIFIIRRKPPSIRQRFEAHQAGDIGISSITVAELEYGAAKSRWPEQARQALEQFLLPLVVVDFDRAASAAYGPIRAFLEAQGQPTGVHDMLIAAQALSLQLTLVTNSTSEFARIPKLQMVDWVQPSE